MKKIALLFLLFFSSNLSLADSPALECGTDEILGGQKQRRQISPEQKDEPSVGDAVKAAWNNFSLISEAIAAQKFSVAARIKDCKKISNSTVKAYGAFTWHLVARKWDPASGKFFEVWQDAQSGKLWGDRFERRMHHVHAIEVDEKNNVLKETACASDEAKIANAGITDRKFKLPTRDDYMMAEQHGIRKVLPNTKGWWFWTATVSKVNDDYAYVFNGDHGFASYMDPSAYRSGFWGIGSIGFETKGYGSVRCVSENN